MHPTRMSDHLHGLDKLSIGAGIICSITSYVLKIHIPKDLVQKIFEAFLVGAAGGGGTWVATKILKIAWTAFTQWARSFMIRKSKK